MPCRIIRALTLSTTLIVFIVMYFAVFGTGISYMLKLVAKGPQARTLRMQPASAVRRTGVRRVRSPRCRTDRSGR